MTDPVRSSRGASFYAPEVGEPSPVHAGAPPPASTPPVCEEQPVSDAVLQLTAKYKPDVSAFLEAQRSSPAPLADAQKLEETKRVIQYAELADAVYAQGAPPPWHRLDDAELQAAGLSSSTFEDPNSGFKAALFRNQSTGEFVLAFAGTEDAKDWRTNCNQGMGNLDAQYQQAIQLGVAVTDAVGDTTMVGHSLGGGLAAAASIASRSQGVTFNAAGLHANTIHYAMSANDSEESAPFGPPGSADIMSRYSEWRAHEHTDKRVVNYHVSGELLTTGQSLLSIPEAQGKQEALPAVGDYTWLLDGVKLHLTGPVIDSLRGRESRLTQ